LKYENLKENIKKVINEIPKEKMKIYLRVPMKDQKNMFQRIKQGK
jgi:predicted site-specific integrase-resolvase